MHFANIQMGNFIWGRVYGLGKIGRGKVYDSLQEYSPLPTPFQQFWVPKRLTPKLLYYYEYDVISGRFHHSLHATLTSSARSGSHMP